MSEPRLIKFCVPLVILILQFLLPVLSASAVEVEMMLVYDNTATNWVNQNGGMAIFSQRAVDKINDVLQASNIEHRFKVAHSMSIDYTSVSIPEDEVAMRNRVGPFADVHNARNTYNADVVALLVDTGYAWGLTGSSDGLSSWAGNPDSPFSVCAIRAVEFDYVLVHEVGHNLGAAHSKYQAQHPGPNINLPDGEYSAGWYFTGSDGMNYATIMAYTDDGKGNYYATAPVFSSPLVTFNGGIAGHSQDGDNRRLLNKTIPVVSSYRGENQVKNMIPVYLLLLGN